MSTHVRALPARHDLGASVLTMADAAAFGVLLVALAAVPVTFSIANSDVFAMPKTIVAVGLAVLLGVLVGLRWIASGARVRDLRRRPLAWAVGGFLAWNLLAWAFAIAPAHALIGERLQYQGLGTTLAYAVYFVAAWSTVRTHRRRSLLLASVVVGASVVTAYAIVQRADLDPIWSGVEINRVFSTIGHSNALAAYLVLTVPLTLCLAVGRPLAIQLVLSGIVLLELAALAFTLSRGGFLGVAVATVVLAIALWPRRRRLITRRVVGIAAAGVVAVSILVPAVPDLRQGAERAVDRILEPGRVEEASTGAHLDQWAVGIAIAADRPLLGAGQDSYVLLFDDYRDRVIEPERARVWEKYRPESPHNVYLAIAGGAGLPALLAYGAIILLVAWGVIAAMRRSEETATWVFGGCLLAAMAGHLVTDAFMTAETTGSMLFWTLMGAGAALVPLRPSARSPASPPPTTGAPRAQQDRPA